VCGRTVVKSNAIRCHREKNTQHKCEWERIRRETSNLLIRIVDASACERKRTALVRAALVRDSARGKKTRELSQSLVCPRARRIAATSRHVVTSRAHTHAPVGTGAGEENYERWWKANAARSLTAPPPHHNTPLAQFSPRPLTLAQVSPFRFHIYIALLLVFCPARAFISRSSWDSFLSPSSIPDNSVLICFSCE